MLSKESGITYKTAWLMLHKIRKAMGERDTKYILADIVELDDAFFGGSNEGGKRGRGADRTRLYIVISKC
jgi:hypothetical protein